jgi:glycosyltransferase involved in cell wall biosynthesis
MLETVYTRLLPARGYRVRWIMDPGGSTDGGREADWNGTPVTVLPRLPAPGRWGRLWRSRLRLRARRAAAKRIVAEGGIDIVQVRNELSSAAVAMRLRQECGIPFVFQLSFPLATDWLSPEAPALARMRHAADRLVRERLQWRVLRRADLVLAISDRMRSDLIGGGLPAERVVSFPLGVDADIRPEACDRGAARRRLGLGDEPTIIFFGAMDRLRRLDFLLDAMVGVRESLPNAVLLMVGTAADPGDLAWLTDQARQRGLGAAVRFLGAVPRREVPQYLVAADISVAPYPPSPHDASRSPLKVLESLGMAVPVVANEEIPDQQMIVSESGGGSTVAYRAEAFAAAAVRWLGDPEARREAGRRGRAFVVAHRSYAVLADELERHYARLLQGRLS